METITKRGRGRPRLGNVLFARRVPPSKIPELMAALTGKADYKPIASICQEGSMEKAVKEIDGLKGQIKALIENVVKLEDEKLELESAVHNLEVMDLDEKGRLGWKLYYGLKGSKSEFDQTRDS